MISVEAMRGKPASEQGVEVVERKGTGHPDYICDAVMEAIAVALSKEYKKAFGAVLHHNIDKGLLAAGSTRKRFGGGRVTRPMELTVGDRATFEFRGKKIPVKDIAIRAAKDWLRDNLRFVDPEKHVKYRVKLAPGSEELADIFFREGAVRTANDTSALVGYYPLSPTEEAVLALERRLNSEAFKRKFPETGEDVKVMGLRNGRDLSLTVAMPLMAGYISSEDEYFKRKALVLKDIMRYTGKFGAFGDVDVKLNALDERGRGLGGVYLSLLGTSAEDADSGQVGRGNRVNGLITMNRPMSTEAAAGKNATSHVGKIYNVLAHRMAEKIFKNVEGVREAHVLLLSRIGTPVDSPVMASAQVLLCEGRKLKDVKSHVSRIVEKELSSVSRFCDELSEGKYGIL
ncbi:MAG: methionine adenosyltransferase [Nitrospirota bacterium]|jgi:S-adenosylmethionine synthetase